MDKFQALHNFWSGFGLIAYDENTVPDNAMMPYLTYEVASSSFDESINLSASLWYRSASWVSIVAKEIEISKEIGRGGKIVSYDDGAFWITKGVPFSQRMEEPSNKDIRRIILSINIEFIDE